MRFPMLAVIPVLGFLSASAAAMPIQGYTSTIGGRAHVERVANGINVDLGTSVVGFVPFEDQSTFRDIFQLDGHKVLLSGVIDGKQQITLTDRAQIQVVD